MRHHCSTRLLVIVRRVVLFVTFAVATTGAAAAGATADLGGQLQSCAAIDTDGDRLECFDRLARSVPAVPANPTVDSIPDDAAVAAVPAPAAITHSAGTVSEADRAPEPSTDDEIGSRYLKRSSIREIKDNPEVAAFTLIKAKRNSRGRWLYYFENGQIWRQIDSQRGQTPETPTQAIIKVGAFGSHKLTIEGRVRGMKVKRLK